VARSIRVCLLFFFFCTACNRSKTCYRTFTNCQQQSLAPLFNGYDSGDLDTVVFYTYTADSSFSTLIDQITATMPDSVFNYTYSGPVYFKNGFEELAIVAGYDYKIYIPKTNQTFKFYGIVDSGRTQIWDCGWNGQCSTTITRINVLGGNFSITSTQIPYVRYIQLSK